MFRRKVETMEQCIETIFGNHGASKLSCAALSSDKNGNFEPHLLPQPLDLPPSMQLIGPLDLQVA